MNPALAGTAATIAATVAAELARRNQTAKDVQRDRSVDKKAIAADLARWRALDEWARDPRYRATAALDALHRTPPACGWDVAVAATDSAARAALVAYQRRGGDEASARTPELHAAGQRWQRLHGLAITIADAALAWSTAFPRKDAA